MSPSPNPNPLAATVRVSPPGYGASAGPGPRPTPTSAGDETWPTEQNLEDLDGLDYGDGDPSAAPPPTDDTGPSPASTDESTAGAIFGLLAQGIVLAGVAVHAWRTPGPPYNVAWQMTEADVHGIGEPLARIIARRVPVGAGKASDISDGIEVAMAATAYVATGLSDEKPIRAAARTEAPAA